MSGCQACRVAAGSSDPSAFPRAFVFGPFGFDLFGSGTISGPEQGERGSFLELAWGGQEPFALADGSTRSYLLDGDEVVMTAWAAGPDGSRIALGEVSGRVLPTP